MIFIFNPETDYALAAGKANYTPPSGVERLRRRLTPQVTSVLREGDKLMAYSSDEKRIFQENPEFREIQENGIIIISPEEAASLDDKIIPWGWNQSLRKRLLRAGVSENRIPSEESISRLRELSHRRTTIEFNLFLNQKLGISSPLPLELNDVEIALRHALHNPQSFIKAPWSSSGRGVAKVTDLSSSALESRICGTIAHQGSIMWEQAADKKIDFATEWILRGGNAQFLGLSVFDTTTTGEYKRNLLHSQSQLISMIKENAPGWSQEYIDSQREALETYVSPFWDGPAGIDMLIDNKGEIWPCIEINLRHTMGHVALAKAGVIALGE